MKVVKDASPNGLSFRCPGCGDMHVVQIRSTETSRPSWEWNGSYEVPTFSPSLLVRCGHYVDGNTAECWCNFTERTRRKSYMKCYVCHSFIRDGNIEFLSDCTHELAGQTVPLPPYGN